MRWVTLGSQCDGLHWGVSVMGYTGESHWGISYGLHWGVSDGLHWGVSDRLHWGVSVMGYTRESV